MTNRLFHVVVALLWFSTMGWLVVCKVLPSLQRGNPPSYQTVEDEENAIVCWRIIWDNRPLGWAASRMLPGVAGVREVHSRVVLADLPLEQLAPAWLGAFVREHVGNIDMDARTQLEIDPLGNLSRFRTSVRLSEVDAAIKMLGVVEDSTLKLSVSAGAFVYQTEKFLPQDALMFNELSPRTRIHDLKLGQRWTVPVYSPFRPPNDPLEIVQAEVESEDFVQWNGRASQCRVVVYRSDPGVGTAAASKPRGKVWVHPDGRVLRQEVTIVNSTMRFERMPDEQAEPFIEKLNRDWLADFNAHDTATRKLDVP